MTERTRASWPVYLLGALCAGAIAAAVLLVGPASGSQTAQSRTATAQSGVVQSTVSGSGNVQAASQLDLGFQTSGTVTHIYVTQGEQVAQGQLLATLDPQSAEVTLEQAKASLQSAEATLAKEEETDGEGSSGQSSSGSSTANASIASTATVHTSEASQISALATTRPTTTPADTTPTSTSPGSPTATTPATTPEQHDAGQNAHLHLHLAEQEHAQHPQIGSQGNAGRRVVLRKLEAEQHHVLVEPQR